MMTSTETEAKWMAAKAKAVRVVVAPGKKFYAQTAYLEGGARVERIEENATGYTTVTEYAR